MTQGFSIRKHHDGRAVLFDEFDQTALMYINSLESQELAMELLLERFNDEGLPVCRDHSFEHLFKL